MRDDRAKRAKDRETLPNFDLNIVALNRFKKGSRIKNISGLRQLWEVLERHQDYSTAFRKARDQRYTGTPVEALALGMIRFFADSDMSPTYNLATLKKKFPGRYIMYRPDWRLGGERDDIMTSLIEIIDAEPTIYITKVQNFPKTETENSYYQKDLGILIPFAKYVHFITREADRGTSVRYGAIDLIVPFSGTEPVDYFHGMLYSTSHQKLYPAYKFFCRRKVDLADSASFLSEAMPLANVPDRAARDYLARP